MTDHGIDQSPLEGHRPQERTAAGSVLKAALERELMTEASLGAAATLEHTASPGRARERREAR